MAHTNIHTALHEQENFLPKKELILVILTLGVVLFVINIDHNGLSTLLPTIAEDLGAQKSITWAGSSQLIATTVFSVLYGRLSDIFGRKALFVSALWVFSIAELGCGFATSPKMLYAMRALTGASGGGIGNLSIIIATDVVSLRHRGQYMAVVAPFMVLGNICGPLIAAGAAKSPLTWRGLFWLISPLGGLSAVLAGYILPSTTPTDTFKQNLVKADWLGSFTSTIAIVGFMVAVSGPGAYHAGYSPLVISLLSVSGVAFLAFLFIEWKLATLPIIPLTIFAIPDVSALLMQTFTLGWVNQANVYFIPLYAQNLRQWSPVISGALLFPIIAVQVIVSMIAGRWMSKSGQYGLTIRLGVAFLLIGSLLETQFGRKTHPAYVIIALLVIGIGVGAANQPMVIAIQAHTKKSERAVVTSSRNFFRFLGSACGVAMSAAILQSTLRTALPAAYKHLADSPYALAGLSPLERDAITPAYERAIRHVFIVSAAASVLCSLGLLVWKDNGYESRPTENNDDIEHAPARVMEGEDEQGSLIHNREPSAVSYGTMEAGEPDRLRRGG
nr:MFS transporter [Didymella macrostoma]